VSLRPSTFRIGRDFAAELAVHAVPGIRDAHVGARGFPVYLAHGIEAFAVGAGLGAILFT
jgi:hypothetical protein